MKVTLIYTETDPWALGMRAISAALREAGHQTHMVFLRSDEAQYSEEALRQTREEAAGSDIIGVTCLARGSEKAKQVIQAVRGTGAFIVWGGTHATLFPQD